MGFLENNLIGVGVPPEVTQLIAYKTLRNQPLMDVDEGVTATGLTLAQAYPITKTYTSFGSVPAGAGARLPSSVEIGGSVWIKNRGGTTLLLYPPDLLSTMSGNTIQSPGSPLGIAVGALKIIVRTGALIWEL